MKLYSSLSFCALVVAAATTLSAQTTTTPPIETATPPTSEWGPRTGDREITFGGAGGSNKDFDSSFGGLNGSYGVFISDMLEVSLRQSINYTNPDNGGDTWNGATRVAGDWHFLPGSLVRPFVGLNLGGVYGEGVHDTFGAGVEAGVKYYVRPKTFLFVTAEYQWYFDRASNADDAFNDGQYTWSAGIGFHF